MSEQVVKKISKRKFDRERKARVMAEQLLEEKSRELYDLNKSLARQKDRLQIALKISETAKSRLSDYIAMTSHELRTPLTAIIGMTNLLMARHKDDEESDKLEVIIEAASALLKKLNLFLDLARIEQRQYKLHYKDFDLFEAMNKFEKKWTSIIELKGLRFELKIDDDVPRFIHNDPATMMRLLDGLMGNARKFTKKGRIDLIVRREGPKLVFDVQDTGIGIEDEFQDKVFERFFKTDSSETRQTKGTGLGLTIARELANLLDGEVNLISTQPKTGSIFQLSVPLKLAEQQSESSGTTDQQTTNLEGLSVLLVEDEPSIQMVVELILQSFGMKVLIASNGQEAVEKASRMSNRFDAILMDLEMPVMGGIEATQNIRALENHNSSIPIIAFTANALVGTEDRCLSAGMTSYLAKPANAKTLKDEIMRSMATAD